MARKISMLAPQWWDFTTLDDEILNDAAKLTAENMAGLSREGFKVVFYDSLEDFYLAEALEYITAWKKATADNPAGICGPIGPTEQLPLVARLVNKLSSIFGWLRLAVSAKLGLPISKPAFCFLASLVLAEAKTKPNFFTSPNGRYGTRTCDLTGVIRAL